MNELLGRDHCQQRLLMSGGSSHRRVHPYGDASTGAPDTEESFAGKPGAGPRDAGEIGLRPARVVI